MNILEYVIYVNLLEYILKKIKFYIIITIGRGYGDLIERSPIISIVWLFFKRYIWDAWHLIKAPVCLVLLIGILQGAPAARSGNR